MKYKAIIFDLDGTAIPNRKDGMPGARLVEIVSKIKDKVFVCAATGRGINSSQHILKELGLTAPCIVSGGTKIVDPVTGEIFWEKLLTHDQVKGAMKVLEGYKYPVYLDNDMEMTSSEEKQKAVSRNIIYSEPMPIEQAKLALVDLKAIPDIVSHLVIAWEPGLWGIHITHKEATKKHAVEVLLGILGVKKEETIGFGDSGNDLPIFEAVGYKVAMSNASEELKAAADYIAPHAEADGLAEAIKKLVL